MRKEKLSTKDISYIKDMFNWNYTIIKKYELYLDLASNENITSKLEELIQMHKDFCQSLIGILKGELDK